MRALNNEFFKYKIKRKNMLKLKNIYLITVSNYNI